MTRVKLTKTEVESAVPREKGDLFLWDAGKGSISGFGLKVTPAGGKTFVMQYRLRFAKSDRRYKIGKFGDWTVETARARARDLRRDIDSGIDPFEKRAAEHKARVREKRLEVDRSFETVSTLYLDHYKVEPRSAGAKKGRKRSERTIEMMEGAMKFLREQFAGKRIDAIEPSDMRGAMDAIPAHQMAKRRNTDACARLLFAWAADRDFTESNPFDAITKRPPTVASRNRVLDDRELALVWLATRRLDYPFGPLFRLLILTGQRRGEVGGLDWQELDRATREWRIPRERTKNGVEHTVPLSSAMLAEFDAMAAKSDKWPKRGLIFTVTGTTPVSGHSRAKSRLDAAIAKIAAENRTEGITDWRTHDLRRTVATGFQRLGVRLEVTEAVLNHVSGSRGGIAGVYQQHDWKPEKVLALNSWAQHVLALNRPKAMEEAASEAG